MTATTSPLHKILDRSGFSSVTKAKYKLVIERWIAFAGESPEGWTRDKAQDFYDHLLSSGVAPQSANTYLNSLRYVSKWYATRYKGEDFAIVQKSRTRKKAEKQGAALLDESEARALILSCRTGNELTPIDRRDLAMIVLGLETGMRRMSFVGATLENIGTQSGFPTMLVPIKGPGGEETYNVPLSSTAMIALDVWIGWLRTVGVHSGAVFRKVSSHFGGMRTKQVYGVGEGIGLAAVNEIIEQRAEQAKIRHVNPHMLRHTFVSWRTIAGLSPLEIAAITGHKVQSVVVGGVKMQIGSMTPYIHPDVDRIRNATPAWLAELVRIAVR